MIVLSGIVNEARASAFNDMHFGLTHALVVLAMVGAAMVVGIAVLWGARPDASDRQNGGSGA